MYRHRFSSLGHANPGAFDTPFPSALVNLTAPKHVFVERTTVVPYSPAGGRTSQLASLINTDTAPPIITGSSFAIDASTSEIDVGVSLKDQGTGLSTEVARVILYINTYNDPDAASPVDITGLYDPVTGAIAYTHAGEPNKTYHYWIQTWDNVGNTGGKQYLGSRDTDNSGLAGSSVTVEDADFTFNFSLTP